MCIRDSYRPGVYVIGDMIVYVENSDGNTNVRFYQAETHKRFFALLDVYKRQEDTFTVGIALEKALSNPKSNADLVLREGDVISIPKNTNTVTINGAVMVPNTVSYRPVSYTHRRLFGSRW